MAAAGLCRVACSVMGWQGYEHSSSAVKPTVRLTVTRLSAQPHLSHLHLLRGKWCGARTNEDVVFAEVDSSDVVMSGCGVETVK